VLLTSAPQGPSDTPRGARRLLKSLRSASSQCGFWAMRQPTTARSGCVRLLDQTILGSLETRSGRVRSRVPKIVQRESAGLDREPSCSPCGCGSRRHGHPRSQRTGNPPTSQHRPRSTARRVSPSGRATVSLQGGSLARWLRVSVVQNRAARSALALASAWPDQAGAASAVVRVGRPLVRAEVGLWPPFVETIAYRATPASLADIHRDSGGATRDKT
jgi:hypothetical protein